MLHATSCSSSLQCSAASAALLGMHICMGLSNCTPHANFCVGCLIGPLAFNVSHDPYIHILQVRTYHWLFSSVSYRPTAPAVLLSSADQCFCASLSGCCRARRVELIHCSLHHTFTSLCTVSTNKSMPDHVLLCCPGSSDLPVPWGESLFSNHCTATPIPLYKLSYTFLLDLVLCLDQAWGIFAPAALSAAVNMSMPEG